MKLKQISLHGSKFLNRPAMHARPVYDPNTGSDSATRPSGDTSQPSGIPKKQRHRKYLGVRTGRE